MVVQRDSSKSPFTSAACFVYCSACCVLLCVQQRDLYHIFGSRARSTAQSAHAELLSQVEGKFSASCGEQGVPTEVSSLVSRYVWFQTPWSCLFAKKGVELVDSGMAQPKPWQSQQQQVLRDNDHRAVWNSLNASLSNGDVHGIMEAVLTLYRTR